MSRHAVHIKVEGRTYSGTFTVDRKVLTVNTSYGSKASSVPERTPHEALAHRLLEELVREEKSRQGSTI